MNFKEAEAEIRRHFADHWDDLTSIAWPDQNFTIPSNETWVRFTCQETDGGQMTMGSPGSNRFRQFGTVIIQIFQPQGQGSIDAREKATEALGAFKGVRTTNDVVFRNAFGRQIGNDDNGFFQINVIASFYYDEIT